MTPERWKQIESIFDSALERKPEQRREFLDAVCGDDTALRREVESLLAHEQPTGRLISNVIDKALDLLPRDKLFSGKDGRFIPGSVLAGRYRIIGLLGKGGMGEVYRADDLKLAQPVALKFLPENLAKDAAMLARFHHEVRIARQISHPNVCRVFDIGEIDGHHFLSMEYIDGEDLASLLRRIGRLPADKAVEIARQLCAGLAAAHDEGVLHRDLKPANVMLDGRGKARITDFGLAGLAEDFHGHELRAGTPAYMAPEQLAGKEVSIRSDIYALGLVIYELFTGKKPFDAATLEELMRQQETTSPPSISSLVKEVDPLVERVILRCLERDPRDRPSSVAHVAAALPGGDPLAAAIAAGETPSPEMVAAAPKKGSLRPAAAVAMFAAALVIIALVIFSTERIRINRQVPFNRSPEVLADRASSLVKKFGHVVPQTDTAYGLEYDSDYANYLREHDKTVTRLNRLASGQPAIIYFWYRQSPRYLEPQTRHQVTLDDPPSLLSGMSTVFLDTEGRLLRFNIIPPQVEREEQEVLAAPDWSALFNEAGLSIADFTQTDSEWLPPVNSDTRVAWTGVFPTQPDIPARIEAAAYQGKPVYFEVLGPWSKPYLMQPYELSASNTRTFIFIFIIFVLIIVMGILMARYNVRRGRGDLKGAFRLAVFLFSIIILSWAIGASHTPTFSGEMTLLWLAVADGLIKVGIVWLLYVALEPFVRRRSPERIISWSRLLAGDFRDPIIGRDILIGIIGGLGFMAISFCFDLIDRWLGNPPSIHRTAAFSTILGLRDTAFRFLNHQPFMSLLHGMGYTLIILLLSLIFRKGWLAGVGFWLLFMMVYVLSGSSAIDLIFSAVAGAMLAFITTRFGLLAMVMTQFFYFMAIFYTHTSDFTAWYAGSAIFALVVNVSFAVYGFYTSLGDQPLFKSNFLED